jgi:hypothetical protein
VVSNNNVKICSATSRDEANKTDLIESEIRKSQLEALSQSLRNNTALTEEHFLNSIELEESISYSYGPPAIQKPTRELYADWLLTQNRNEEAKEQYELTLKLAPKRLLSLKGIEQAKG